MCLGKHNLTYTEPSEHCFNVSGIYRHEGFKYPTVPTVEFDIALIRLDGEVTPSDQISYACLPSEEEMLPEAKKCYATGWGDETGAVSEPQYFKIEIEHFYAVKIHCYIVCMPSAGLNVQIPLIFVPPVVTI